MHFLGWEWLLLPRLTNCFGRAQNPTGYSVWVWHIVPPSWRVQLDQEIHCSVDTALTMAPPKTGAEKAPAPVGGKVIFKSNTESSRLHPL